jgi:hypothetical protein
VTLPEGKSRYYGEPVAGTATEKGKMLMKKIAVFATILLAGFAQSRLHATECSNGDLRGVYSFVASGTFGGAPFAAVGQTTYQGNGQANGWIQIDLNGTILPVPKSGAPPAPGTWTATYTVDPSTCLATKTITLDATFGPLANASLTFFITAGSDFRELRFLLTNTSAGMPTGTAISGTARRQ